MAQEQLMEEAAPTAATPLPASGCVAMLESHPLFRAIFDHAPLAQLIASAEGMVGRVNPAFTSLLGYAPDEVCGKSVMAFTHPDDVAKSWSSARRVGLNLPRLTFQKRYLHKSGRTISALVTLSAVELDGARCILGQIVDLTAFKQAHADAQQAHERLQSAMEGAGAGTWDVDFATGHMEWDGRMRGQFGLADEQPAPDLEAFIAAVHEEDRRSVVAAIHNATLPGHGRFDHEYRIRCADGLERWYRGVGRVCHDEAGRAIGGAGIAFDITKTKQAQLDRERMQSALHRAERRLAAIVANSRDAIVGASADLRVTAWNAAAEALFGYTGDEVLGMSVIHLLAPERHHLIGTRLAQLMAGQTLAAVESLCLRKDGTRVDVEISLSPVPGDDGSPVWFSAIVRDISERKATERRLAETQHRIEEIARTVDQVFWTADPAIERMLYVSPSYERIWGRSCESLYADPRSFIEAVHPDDRETLGTSLAMQRAGQHFSHEYRIVRPDGSVRWIWDRGHPVRNAAGKVTHYIGVAVDVTDRPGEPKEAAAR